MTRVIIRLVCAAVALSAVPGAALAADLRPFDEARNVASFQKYRAGLIEAVRGNDVDAVVRAAAPNIKVSFGADNGRKAFREMLVGTENLYGKGWRQEAARYRRDLLRILRLGGGFVRNRQRKLEFVAPYTEAHTWRVTQQERRGIKVKQAWTKWEGSELGFITRARVTVYKYPNRFSEKLGTLGHRIVRLGNDVINRPLPHKRYRQTWQSIRISRNKLGWVDARAVHAAFGYRAYFSRIGGRWQMTTFVAGD